MKNIITRTALALAISLAPLAAFAADGLKSARILPGWRAKDGTHIAALELLLEDGWKTYWRSPGETGFPPRFDFESSANVRTVEILWPAPHRYEHDGVTTIGYTGKVIIPLRISPDHAGQMIDLKSVVELGVCKDICVPVQLDISQELPPSLTQRSGIIVSALADRPMTAKEAGVVAVSCDMTPDQKSLNLRATIEMPRKWQSEIAIIEPFGAGLYVEQSATERQGDVLIARANVSRLDGSAMALGRNDLRVTVIGETGAVEIIGCQNKG